MSMWGVWCTNDGGWVERSPYLDEWSARQDAAKHTERTGHPCRAADMKIGLSADEPASDGDAEDGGSGAADDAG